jgi:hypothetical protein
MVSQSAALNIADKLFVPPIYITLYHNREFLTDHQLNFFAVYDSSEKETLKKELLNFGMNLKNRIQKESFEWNGFGTLRSSSDSIVFVPKKIILSTLQPVIAKKVIHEHADHKILVGDRHMTSRQVMNIIKLPVVKKSVVYLLAWVVLAIAVIALVYLLYSGNFEPGALGLKISPDS